jgi:hypothetical protein
MELETDPRFPSGPWMGYFLQHGNKGMMDLHLTFRQGALTGEGRDYVGQFVVRGRYELADGKCYWTKRYLGKHDVFYQGYNEGKGIWGQWEITTFGLHNAHGGFHIWPKGMAEAEHQQLAEEADLPVLVEGALETSEPLVAPLLELRQAACLSGLSRTRTG